MQKLGQHFLKNAAILRTIADAVAMENDDRVIEIGPGHGELTVPLADAAAAHGAHGKIFCIEKDRTLIDGLQTIAAQKNLVAQTARREKSASARVNIIEGDALKLLPGVVAKKILRSEDGGAAPYKIAGNIPYYITGKLLRVISELEYKPERVVLLIQKEVAERICAAPPNMNRLAASVQFWARAEIIADVPRKDFSPPPDVDSAVIVLKTKKMSSNIDPTLYYETVRAIFAQPRKTLVNNLGAMAGRNVSKNEIVAQIKKIGCAPDARPQDLSIEQIVSLARLHLRE